MVDRSNMSPDYGNGGARFDMDHNTWSIVDSIAYLDCHVMNNVEAARNIVKDDVVAFL